VVKASSCTLDISHLQVTRATIHALGPRLNIRSHPDNSSPFPRDRRNLQDTKTLTFNLQQFLPRINFQRSYLSLTEIEKFLAPLTPSIYVAQTVITGTKFQSSTTMGQVWRTTFTVYHASPQGLKIIRRWLQRVRSIRPLQNPQLSEMLFHCYRAAWNSSGEVVPCGQLQICKSHSLLTIVMQWKQNPVFYDRTWLCTVIYIWQQVDQKTSKFNSTTLLMNFHSDSKKKFLYFVLNKIGALGQSFNTCSF
jgi:hypothetical protein